MQVQIKPHRLKKETKPSIRNVPVVAQNLKYQAAPSYPKLSETYNMGTRQLKEYFLYS